MRKKLVSLSLLFTFILISTSGFSCKLSNQNVQEAMKPVNLVYWRVFDGEDDFKDIIKQYQAMHPYVKIEYRRLRYDEYEYELLNALAEDRGPDIFSIHNTWVKKYESKIAPLPPSTTMVYPVEKGSIKKEIVNEIRTTPSLTLKGLRDNFADVVAGDAVIDDKIYGLPLSIDTLAMYYNRDLLNNAGIAQPTLFWNQEFLKSVNKLTRIDSRQGILQSGAALGGSFNINRSTDILSALMIQNGATMMSDEGSVSFHIIPPFARESGYNPGMDALRFYTDFANPTKESYSWNEELPNSLDMFISGNLAIMFSYSYDLETIRTQAPKLNFSVTTFPQIGNTQRNVYFANYWLETVSKKSAYQNEAWDFIQFMTTKEQVIKYLTKTKKPAALKSLIPEQMRDDELGVFASQVLNSKSWYKGRDAQSAETAIKEMIKTVVLNPTIKMQEVINNAASRVQQTIR